MSVIAINVVLIPGAATAKKAQATNARLREDYRTGSPSTPSTRPTSRFCSGTCGRRASSRSPGR